MIIGYTGPLGSGKTLRVVMDGYRYSLAAGGAPIWANFTLKPEAFIPHRVANPTGFKVGRIRTTDDIVRAVVEGGGIMEFDEIHQDIDARLSTQMSNILLTQFLMFLRKCGLTCLYSTQDEVQIDKRMRRVTDVLVTCQGTGGREARQHLYTTYHYLSGRSLGTVAVDSDTSRPYYAMYDTYEFTRRLKFPSNLRDFERFMIRLEGGAAFAREYDGPKDRAWEAFLSQSGDSQTGAGAGGESVLPKSHVRKGKGRSAGSGRRSDPGGATELASEAEAGG